MATKNNSGRRRSRRLSQVEDEMVPATETPEMNNTNGDELIGTWVDVNPLGAEPGTHRCFVMGCQYKINSEGNRTEQMYQVYDSVQKVITFVDSAYEIERVDSDTIQNLHEWVGKRIVVWWKGRYSSQIDQSKARRKFGKQNTKVPFEAWIVAKVNNNNNFLITYTVAGENEVAIDRKKLIETDDDWMFVGMKDTTVRGVPIVSWSGNLDLLVDVPSKK